MIFKIRSRQFAFVLLGFTLASCSGHDPGENQETETVESSLDNTESLAMTDEAPASVEPTPETVAELEPEVALGDTPEVTGISAPPSAESEPVLATSADSGPFDTESAPVTESAPALLTSADAPVDASSSTPEPAKTKRKIRSKPKSDSQAIAAPKKKKSEKLASADRPVAQAERQRPARVERPVAAAVEQPAAIPEPVPVAAAVAEQPAAAIPPPVAHEDRQPTNVQPNLAATETTENPLQGYGTYIAVGALVGLAGFWFYRKRKAI